MNTFAVFMIYIIYGTAMRSTVLIVTAPGNATERQRRQAISQLQFRTPLAPGGWRSRAAALLVRGAAALMVVLADRPATWAWT